METSEAKQDIPQENNKYEHSRKRKMMEIFFKEKSKKEPEKELI